MFLCILFSCWTLFEGFVLTCNPAGVVHVNLLAWPIGLSLSHCWHVFANSVRSCRQKAPCKSPRGQGATGAAWSGQGWDNLASCSLFGLDICAISQKHVRQVFSWIKALAKLAPLNSGLAGFASRAGWAHGPGPGTGLSPGGFLAASCQKQGKGRLPCTDNPS